MLDDRQPVYMKAESLEDFHAERLLLSIFKEKREQSFNTWGKDIYHHEVSQRGLEEHVSLERFKEIFASVSLNIRVIHEDSKDFEEPYEPTFYLMAENTEAITVIQNAPHYFSLKTWADTIEKAREINSKIFACLPQEEKEENAVDFKFWKLGPQDHPFASDKQLVCPKFEEVRDNYTQGVIDQFEALTNLKKPDEFGRIILWHGAPGSGKTYLIRALAREWASKHDISPEVIIDPESFFSNSFYLDTMLTSASDADTFRLIIIEDYANIVSTGCRTNPGFSRLLNTTDGLLGQGQRVIFLLTANEPLDVIDPAILRPGRCLQRMEVPPMTADEGVAWLHKKKADHLSAQLEGKKQVSLADLFAIFHGNPFAQDPGSSSKSGFGFAN